MAKKKKIKNIVKKSQADKCIMAKDKTYDKFNYKKLDIAMKLIGLLLFAIISIVLYFQCFNYGYVLDDKLVISENNFTKLGFTGIWELLTTDTFMGYLGEKNDLLPGGRYRPLSLITFAIEYQLLGLNPEFSHFVNAVLYGFCGFITWITLRRLFLEKSVSKLAFLSFSFIAAVIFIAHPIHTEAIANIKGRDEILSYLFSLLTLLMALKFVDSRRLYLMPLMAGVYIFGMLSKENSITFLFIVPMAMSLFRPKNKKALIWIVAVMLLSTIGYLALRYSIIGFSFEESNDLLNNPFVGMTVMEKYATISYTLLKYVSLMFVPVPLTHDYYPYHIPILNFSDWRVILSLLLHGGLIVSIFYFWTRHRVIAFAIVFYFASISIVSNVVVGVGTFMNERFAFTASLAACIAMLYVMKKAATKVSNNRNTYLYSTGLIVIFYALLTISRVPAWESEYSLNSEAIKVSKNSARANTFMATALFNRYKEMDDNVERQSLVYQAEPYALKSLEILPSYKNANIMLAGIAAEKYKYDRDLPQLLASFRRVASNRPDVDYIIVYLKYLNERADFQALVQFYTEIGQILRNQHKDDWALHYLMTAYNDGISNKKIKQMIHNILISQGRTSEAQRFQ